MPKIEQTIADVNVRAHTFKYITPWETDALQIPNACNLCHTDKATKWTTDALKNWQDRSPWRVAQPGRTNGRPFDPRTADID
jgi:hypothetical protein